jgi:hypothetical protein
MMMDFADFLHEHGITYDDIAKFCLEGTCFVVGFVARFDSVYCYRKAIWQ